MRTGHSPMFAYLLMSGSVFVNIEMKSQDDEKKKFVRTAAVLQRGSLFGVSQKFHFFSAIRKNQLHIVFSKFLTCTYF